MSCEVKQLPRLLNHTLLQPVISEMPHQSSSVMKHKIQIGADDRFQENFKERMTDFIDSVVEAVTMDKVLGGLLNFVKCGQSDKKEWFVVVTVRKVFYYEPARHVASLRLVLTARLLHAGKFYYC